MAKKKKHAQAGHANGVDPNLRLDRYLSAFALALRSFADSRDWDKYHTPRNLAIAVFSEAGELANEFRWTETPHVARVADELADVFIFTCMLADRMDINLAQVARDKVAKNAGKYPPVTDSALPKPEQLDFWQNSDASPEPLIADQDKEDSIPATPPNSVCVPHVAGVASRRSGAATSRTRKK